MLLPSPVFTNFAEPELRQRALHCGYGDKHEYKRVVVDILADMIIGPACHVWRKSVPRPRENRGGWTR